MYDAYNSVDRIGDAYLVTSAGRRRGPTATRPWPRRPTPRWWRCIPASKSLFDAALTRDARPRPQRQGGKLRPRARRLRRSAATWSIARRRRRRPQEQHLRVQRPAGLPRGRPLHPEQGYYASTPWSVDPFAVDSLDQFAARRLDDGTPAGRAWPSWRAKSTRWPTTRCCARAATAASARPRAHRRSRPRSASTGRYDGRPGLGTPPRLYNQIARTVAIQEGNTEAENARLFALVNIAMADAGLTSWDNKYDDDFWRPIMGIRNGATRRQPGHAGRRELDAAGRAGQQPAAGRDQLHAAVPGLHLRPRHVRRRGVPDPDAVLRPRRHLLHVRLRRVQRRDPRRRRLGPSAASAGPSTASPRPSWRTPRAASTSASTGPSIATTASARATRWPTTCSRTRCCDPCVVVHRRLWPRRWPAPPTRALWMHTPEPRATTARLLTTAVQLVTSSGRRWPACRRGFQAGFDRSRDARVRRDRGGRRPAATKTEIAVKDAGANSRADCHDGPAITSEVGHPSSRRASTT